MLRTLRIWRKMRYLGIYEWPWRSPWSVLNSWKYSYTSRGGRYLLRSIWDSFLANFEWYIPTKRTIAFRREVRATYLRSRIFVLEWQIKRLEEEACEKEKLKEE